VVSLTTSTPTPDTGAALRLLGTRYPVHIFGVWVSKPNSRSPRVIVTAVYGDGDMTQFSATFTYRLHELHELLRPWDPAPVDRPGACARDCHGHYGFDELRLEGTFDGRLLTARIQADTMAWARLTHPAAVHVLAAAWASMKEREDRTPRMATAASRLLKSYLIRLVGELADSGVVRVVTEDRTEAECHTIDGRDIRLLVDGAENPEALAWVPTVAQFTIFVGEGVRALEQTLSLTDQSNNRLRRQIEAMLHLLQRRELCDRR
jgi:hypothetical protein